MNLFTKRIHLREFKPEDWAADPTQIRYAYLMSSVLIFTLEIETVGHAWNEDVAELE